MPSIELESALPYMIPEYWDGNTLGINAVPCGEFLPRDYMDFARDALKRKLSMLHGGYKPLARLVTGQTFEPNEHPPGTVIRLRRETAAIYSAESRLNPYDVELEETFRGFAQSVLSPKSISGTVKNYGSYENNEYWGVVTPPNEGQQGLLGFPGRFVMPKLKEVNEYRFLSAATRIVPHQFEVGKIYGAPLVATAPFKNRTHKTRYRRVVAAEVVGWAGKKQPSKLKQAAQKLGELIVPGQAPNPVPIHVDPRYR